MRLQLVRAALIAAILGVGFAAPAGAAITEKVKRACTGDYKRLCPSYKVGSNQLRACMEAKHGDLSSTCRDALIAAGEYKQSSSRR